MEPKTIVKKKKVLSNKLAKPLVSPAPSAQERTGLHNLKVPRGAHKRRRVLGRGPSSGHGKTSTRGSKGQTSRAGRHFYLGFEGGQSPLIRRFPKRGFTSLFKKEYQIVNLESIAKIKDATITPQLLEAKGLIKDKNKPVKILSDGELKRAVTVQAHAFSVKAQEKIKGAGGQCEVLLRNQ
jgi:large subunit ribosomal protein L15